MFKLAVLALLASCTSAIKLQSKVTARSTRLAQIKSHMKQSGDELYDFFDLDGNGEVNAEEYESTLMAICGMMEYEPSDQDVADAEALFAAADTDGSGGVSQEEAGELAEEFLELIGRTGFV